MMRRSYYRLAPAALCAALLMVSAAAAKAVDGAYIDIPQTFIGFSVGNASSTTTAQPNPFTVSFSGASLTAPNNCLQFYIYAASDTMTPPAGQGIPTNLISWNGSATSGLVSPHSLSSAQTLFWTSKPGDTAGTASLTFQLASLMGVANIRAGSQTVFCTVKIVEAAE